jgi:hypothetical protein
MCPRPAVPGRRTWRAGLVGDRWRGEGFATWRRAWEGRWGRWAACAIRPRDRKPEEEKRNPPADFPSPRLTDRAGLGWAGAPGLSTNSFFLVAPVKETGFCGPNYTLSWAIYRDTDKRAQVHAKKDDNETRKMFFAQVKRHLKESRRIIVSDLYFLTGGPLLVAGNEAGERPMSCVDRVAKDDKRGRMICCRTLREDEMTTGRLSAPGPDAETSLDDSPPYADGPAAFGVRNLFGIKPTSSGAELTTY